MMTINIVCVGNMKEKFSKEYQEEDCKRLSAFCKLNIIEVKEQNQLSNPEMILEKEGEEILKKLKGYSILCDINSTEIGSEKFAKKLKDLSLKTSTLSFVIGGSYGVSQSVRSRCDERISFSLMTFPHNLFRIMLLEQIYRGFMIESGKSYHK